MNASAYPLVSIVTINFNQTPVTRDLLLSLRNISYPSIEIIVVDNGSRDTSARSLKQEFPEINLIETGKNLGFAGGNNVGLEQAKGEYLLLINNDVEVVPGFLEPLVGIFQQQPEAGIASPRIVYFDRNELIQYAGAVKINPYTGRGKKLGHLETDTNQYNWVRETELGHGACLLTSRKVLEAVGMLPEVYFLYYEEHDWTEQVKRAGYKVYYVGTSKVYHKESISVGKNNPIKTYYLARNRILYLKRNTKGLTQLSSMLFFFLLAVPKDILKLLLRMDFPNLKSYIQGISWHLNH
ncbi:MAG TPA: glycosyltransferase family 2 protein [Ohtaekwangia sp.]|uniref:glycosyltransferase family 2 protein n=1 Tax=Ohtaekwangia sp. TaxID=2066019 RepID=UPI002F942D2B